MLFISKDNLKQIFSYLILNSSPYYSLLLKCVNKEWKEIVEQEQDFQFQKQWFEEHHFYSFVQDFICHCGENVEFQFHSYSQKYILPVCARFGYLELIKWIFEKQDRKIKIEIENQNQLIAINIDELSCGNAVFNGHLECLKYLHENGCPWDEWSCYFAASCGYLDILKYLHENNCPYDKEICLKKAKNQEIKNYTLSFM